VSPRARPGKNIRCTGVLREELLWEIALCGERAERLSDG
jgi:hypothetical protein